MGSEQMTGRMMKNPQIFALFQAIVNAASIIHQYIYSITLWKRSLQYLENYTLPCI